MTGIEPDLHGDYGFNIHTHGLAVINYNACRYQYRLSIQTPMQAFASTMARKKIRRLFVETAN